MRTSVAEDIYYPGDPEVLKERLRELLNQNQSFQKRPAKGIWVPHDRYELCAPLLAKIFARIELPPVVILLGPNHTDMGESIAIVSHGSWLTPLGEIQINQAFAEQLMERCPLLREDELAHLKEHAIEAQLPFLQYLSPQCQIVPILFKEISHERCQQLANAIYQTMTRDTRVHEKPALIIATSHLSHFEDPATTQQQEALALEKIKELDSVGLCAIVKKNEASMCGLAPIAILLDVMKNMGVAQPSFMRNNNDSAVGYIGALFS